MLCVPCVYLCMWEKAIVLMSKDDLWELVLSCHVGRKDPAQAFSIEDKLLYPLSHLSCPTKAT